MNIIVIPEGIRKGQTASFSHRHLLLIALVVGVVLPVFFGVLTYRIHLLLDRYGGAEERLVQYEAELAAQAHAIDAAKADAATHLNALARRLGQLQAQVLRLNALGGRLTHMAGLDTKEFNFEADVAQGGPEAPSIAGGSEVAASLTRLTAEVSASEARLKALETLLLDRRLTDAVTPAGWPADGGFLSSPFGRRADPFTGRMAFHEGVDIAAKLGSAIRAMADGVVTFAGHKAQYGNCVELTHARGLVTRYGHALAILVKVGDKVTRGQAIARVGSTGRSTGPHVHVEVLKNGHQVNPAGYLRRASFTHEKSGAS
jgi:murein DD-endopeptidase MepM/ murein hydrolase activator NlpD